MIEAVIPEDCFILFSCCLVHYGTPSWFINRGEYGKITRAFFTIVEKDIFLMMKSLFRKKIGFVNQNHVNYVLTINTQPMRRMVH